MTHHKLIHAASERVLSDAKTLLEEHVQDEGKGARGPRPKQAEQGDAAATGFRPPLLKQSVRPGIKELQPSGEARCSEKRKGKPQRQHSFAELERNKDRRERRGAEFRVCS